MFNVQSTKYGHIVLLIKFIWQVSGPELNPVPGGYNSGSPSQAGSFKVCLGKKGQFTFLRFVFSLWILCKSPLIY